MILMYDLIIIGSGPAGLTAAIFARRQGMNTLVLDNPSQLSNLEITPMIENYPGFGSISGKDLIDKMKKQVIEHGCEIKKDKVIVILRQDDHFLVKARNDYEAKAVILATGL